MAVSPELDMIAFSSTMTRICEHVFVGGYRAARDEKQMRENGITGVLKLFKDESGYKRYFDAERSIRYEVLDVKDGDDASFVKALRKSMRFLKSHKKKRGTILIHCHIGASRSPSVAIAHLMIHHGMPYESALKLVTDKRPGTEIKFARVLMKLDAIRDKTRETQT